MRAAWGIKEWFYDNYKYVGVSYEHDAKTGEFKYSMKDFLEKIYPVPNKEIAGMLDYSSTAEGEDRPLNDLGKTRFRGGLGGLQWLAKEGRPDVLGDLAILSVEFG